MGRHNKPSTSSAGVAKIAVTGAIIGSGSVALAAQAQAAPDSEWDVVARCESSGNWSEDSGNGFYGGLQFTLESWQAVGGSGNPASTSQNEQIMRGSLLQARQGWVAWPACASQLGLT